MSAKKQDLFAPPHWYGQHLDESTWRQISHAGVDVTWKTPREWNARLRGQYVYYLPNYTLREDTRLPEQNNVLQHAGFAEVRYSDHSNHRWGKNNKSGKHSPVPVPAKRIALSAKQLTLLKRLLEVDGYSDLLDEHGAPACVAVVPRAGMVSPWASKTQDILRNCGLGAVSHIERGRLISSNDYLSLSTEQRQSFYTNTFDSMMEELWDYQPNSFAGQGVQQYRGINYIPVQHYGLKALQRVNEQLSLHLDDQEMHYLHALYQKWARDPTDAELMMFAQINSEHCRHKIFNAHLADAKDSPDSLFAMIKNTARCAPKGVTLAYNDNAAVVEGYASELAYIDSKDKHYRNMPQTPTYLLIKVETHNHPTAIAPFAGAGTGVGGEIRDEMAVGRGSHSIMGMSGYSTSYLRLPEFIQAWEAQFDNLPTPKQTRSALDIMLRAPIGAAAFSNEFGRPNLCGYFRSYEARQRGRHYGYHKPIMIAGGAGVVIKENIQPEAHDAQTDPSLKILVMGGPSLLIGLGGGSASSTTTGASDASAYASVQRQNPQMQRRCLEVVDRCAFMGKNNPIVRIHDVGGGGLANAIPELLHEFNCGARIDLDAIPSADPALSPMELWCNESQERFVLAVKGKDIKRFDEICKRERCPYAVVGKTDNSGMLLVHDKARAIDVVDMPLKDLFPGTLGTRLQFGKKPTPLSENPLSAKKFDKLDFEQAVLRVLSHPTVASKDFLINIADRSVGGLVCRDQMVGRWQVAVADSAVSCSDHHGYSGVAMAVGERAPIAVWDPLASVRMAVGEALTNIACNVIEDISDIKLSVNWMAAAADPEERNRLMHAVRDLGMQLCPELGIAVVVGKDSLSMHSRWSKNISHHRRTIDHEMFAPLSAVVTAVAPLKDVRQCKTPELLFQTDARLVLIDLGRGKNRMGASCLMETHIDIFGETELSCPNLDNPADARAFMNAMRACYQDNLILAYHDRSDGGLFACLMEMCFATHTGLNLHLTPLVSNYGEMMRLLFSEELGAVVQVNSNNLEAFTAHWAAAGLRDCIVDIGTYSDKKTVHIRGANDFYYERSLADLYAMWHTPSMRICALRDNPQCIEEEKQALSSYDTHAGLFFVMNFDYQQATLIAPYVNLKRPRLAVLREQGTNGHYEMAMAFDQAQFEAVDVHTSDIFSGAVSLRDFQGMAIAGGFSYGDVLGAGRGWAQSILWNERARDEFQSFFARPDIFVLGVCNGCQMLSALRELIPGSDHWPHFRANLSGQFEARLSMVEILNSTSVLMRDMENSFLAIPIAHGEGRAYCNDEDLAHLKHNACLSMRYVSGMKVACAYPNNPNGSIAGIAGVSNEDGRVTIMMPHPERVFRTVQYSWKPEALGESSPWIRMFCNARKWVAEN